MLFVHLGKITLSLNKENKNESNETVFTASAGGVVTVEVYGTKEIKSVKVSDDFEAEEKEDYEMLGEMIVAACNETYKKIDKTIEEKMSKYSALTGGMGGLF